MKVLKVAIFFAVLTVISAQNLNINCQFTVENSLYTCLIAGITVPDNENANFIIGGQHQAGRTNADVQAIAIFSSTVPFIITQFFTTFPNVQMFALNAAGLTRIQPNVFANARALTFIAITFNPTLRAINANAFSGATVLEAIDLFSNEIETIHENAFAGLNSLHFLYLDWNRIQEFHVNVFRPLTSLEILIFSDNQLQSLDGQLLQNNRQLLLLSISRNQINAIGRAFLDNMPFLSSFGAIQNVCVNQNWNIGGATTIDTIRQGLATCFNNSIDPPADDFRRFILELRGPFTLRYENGTEIIRV